MKKFKILVHGENLNVYLDGELVRAGCYVTRVISAMNETLAKEVAIKELKHLPELRAHMVHDARAPETFAVEAIEEIEGPHGLETSPSGLVFYRMDLQ